jgi:hypothetical protein
MSRLLGDMLPPGSSASCFAASCFAALPRLAADQLRRHTDNDAKGDGDGGDHGRLAKCWQDIVIEGPRRKCLPYRSMLCRLTASG